MTDQDEQTAGLIAELESLKDRVAALEHQVAVMPATLIQSVGERAAIKATEAIRTLED